MHYVYIMTNKKNGTLYIGTTRNLFERVQQHKSKEFAGFTKDNNCTMLVYYEEYKLATEAIQREKNMKKWKRFWKLRVIEEMNSEWNDLSLEWE
jgi:putative endonuclease